MIKRTKFEIFKTAPYDNERGLIGWWPFHTRTAIDFSGNQNNGVATGSPVYADSEVGGSFGFSVGNYFLVSTPGNSNPIDTNAVTVACWLTPNVTSRGDIISVWQSDGANPDQFVLLYGLTAGKPEFFIQGTGGTPSSGVGATTMVVGTRYHVAGTFDGTNISVYLNGKLEATTVNAGTLGTGIADAIQIGGSVGSTNSLNGSLSDARLYNRALSAQEINDLYNQGITRFSLSPDEWEIPALYTSATVTNLMSQIWM